MANGYSWKDSLMSVLKHTLHVIINLGVEFSKSTPGGWICLFCEAAPGRGFLTLPTALHPISKGKD